MDLHRTAGRVGADAEADQLLLKARREITEHCLYGVDINPLAVEMAKLSLWLITMDTERPFGFLDDRLAAGDSLARPGQPGATGVAARGREGGPPPAPRHPRLRLGMARQARPGRRPPPQDHRHRRRHDPRHRTQGPAARPGGETVRRDHQSVADAITAAGLANAKLKGKKLDAGVRQRCTSHDQQTREDLAPYVEKNLQDPRPAGTVEREPFHWPLAFPEIFADTTDAWLRRHHRQPAVSRWPKKISGTYGDDYLAWLAALGRKRREGHRRPCNEVPAARRSPAISRKGQLGFVTTKTVVEGAPLRVGMDQVTQHSN